MGTITLSGRKDLDNPTLTWTQSSDSSVKFQEVFHITPAGLISIGPAGVKASRREGER